MNSAPVTGSFNRTGVITNWTLGGGGTLVGSGTIATSGSITDLNGTRAFTGGSGLIQANTDGSVSIIWTATDPLSGTGIGAPAPAFRQ